MILRSTGCALVGDSILELKMFDCVEIKPHTWHQFHACTEEPFGFLCLVTTERDRPHRPSDDELEKLRSNKLIAPMLIGCGTFAMIRKSSNLVKMVHPAFAGTVLHTASHGATHGFLLETLFRLIGAPVLLHNCIDSV